MTSQQERALRTVPCNRTQCPKTRPCYHVRCRYHLAPELKPPYQGAARRTSISITELEAMIDTCCLDVAERGGETLEEIGDLLGMTRERIRQIEAAALRKLERQGVCLLEHLPLEWGQSFWEIIDLQMHR